MQTRKEAFAGWLVQQIHGKDSKNYSRRTARDYAGSLSSSPRRILGDSAPDLFSVSSLEEFDRERERIEQAPGYESEDKRYHNTFSCALDAYRSFLQGVLPPDPAAPGQETSEAGNAPSVPEVIKHVKRYISASGFTYPDGMIENFYLSLTAKPFVILAGISGTGKTRLAKLFAESVSAEYQLVPVRPDWSDSTDLFGRPDLNGRFHPGPVLDFLRHATDFPETPHILCLDEMNLARVEYYLSDWLSVLETREFRHGRIVTQPLVPASAYGSDADALAAFGPLSIPDNLFLVGTVNMDETTFPFSRKVLDRAGTIEFSEIDLMPPPPVRDRPAPLRVPSSVFRSRWLVLMQCREDPAFVREQCAILQELNRILQPANAHFGYRVRDEIIFYLLRNRIEGNLISDSQAMDNAIMQKVLPRLTGSSAALSAMLSALFEFCSGQHIETAGPAPGERMESTLQNLGTACRYPRSAARVALMKRRLEDDGFAAFWL